MEHVSLEGLLVVRGPDWKWENQDGGEGNVGAIVESNSGNSHNFSDVVDVVWNNGVRGNYRAGFEGASDLAVFDTTLSGRRRTDYTCDGCQKPDSLGIRWKCMKCEDFNLCQECYFSDVHDVHHPFYRIDTPTSKRVIVSARSKSRKVRARGVHVAAAISRDLRQEGLNQDPIQERKYAVNVENDTETDGVYYYVDHLPPIAEYAKRTQDRAPNGLKSFCKGDLLDLVRDFILEDRSKPAKENGSAFIPDDEIVKYHFRRKQYVQVEQKTGIIQYKGPRLDPVALVSAVMPFSNDCPYFEIEIVDVGQSGYIAIGAIPEEYEIDRQPGWDPGSIGYHADDGGIFNGHGYSDDHLLTCAVGDKMGCSVTSSGNSKRICFKRNGAVIFETTWEAHTTPLYPAVGMQSPGEKVRLVNLEPWRPRS